MDKADFSEIYANIDILPTQALFVMNSPYTPKIMQIATMLKLFSNLIPIRKNLPPHLNKGFIEPPCTSSQFNLIQFKLIAISTSSTT